METKKFKCPVCEKEYKSIKTMEKHVKAKHPETIDKVLTLEDEVKLYLKNISPTSFSATAAQVKMLNEACIEFCNVKIDTKCKHSIIRGILLLRKKFDTNV